MRHRIYLVDDIMSLILIYFSTLQTSLQSVSFFMDKYLSFLSIVIKTWSALQKGPTAREEQELSLWFFIGHHFSMTLRILFVQSNKRVKGVRHVPSAFEKICQSIFHILLIGQYTTGTVGILQHAKMRKRCTKT